MNVLQIEEALLSKLQEELSELSVEAFPDKPDDYDFIHPVGAVLVKYDSSSFSDDYCLAYTAQYRTLTFMVVSLTRNLRTHCGCYDVLERIRNAILGLKLPGLEQVKQVDEQFSDETDGIWTYIQTFNIKTLALQQLPNFTAQDPDYE